MEDKTLGKKKAETFMTEEDRFRVFFGLMQKVSEITKKRFVLPSAYDESDLNAFTASIGDSKSTKKPFYTVLFEFPQRATCIRVCLSIAEKYGDEHRKLVFNTFPEIIGNRDKQKMVYFKMYGYNKKVFQSPKINWWDPGVIFTPEMQQAISTPSCKEKTDPRAAKQKLCVGISVKKHTSKLPGAFRITTRC